MNMSSTPRDLNEEPEVTQEESVPSDGRDHDGENMMKQVSNPQLADSEPTPSTSGKTPAGRSI